MPLLAEGQEPGLRAAVDWLRLKLLDTIRHLPDECLDRTQMESKGWCLRFYNAGLARGDARQAARMNQVIGIINAYGYGSIIGKVVWQRLIMPTTGGQGDEAIVRDAAPMVSRCLSEFHRIKGGDRYLAGPEITLADLFLAPLFAYLTMTPDAKDLLQPFSGLRSWWEQMSTRDTITNTQPKFG